MLVVEMPGRPPGRARDVLTVARAWQRRGARSTSDMPPRVAVRAQTHSGRWSRDVDGARSAAATAAELGAEFGGLVAGIGYAPLARAAVAAGDVAVATEA